MRGIVWGAAIRFARTTCDVYTDFRTSHCSRSHLNSFLRSCLTGGLEAKNYGVAVFDGLLRDLNCLGHLRLSEANRERGGVGMGRESWPKGIAPCAESRVRAITSFVAAAAG